MSSASSLQIWYFPFLFMYSFMHCFLDAWFWVILRDFSKSFLRPEASPSNLATETTSFYEKLFFLSSKQVRILLNLSFIFWMSLSHWVLSNSIFILAISSGWNTFFSNIIFALEAPYLIKKKVLIFFCKATLTLSLGISGVLLTKKRNLLIKGLKVVLEESVASSILTMTL